MRKTYAIRSLFLSLLVNGAFLWLVNDALAADYYTVSIGQTTLAKNKSFGWWNQDTSDQVFNETSASWSVKAGWNVTPALSLEIGYRDLGKFSTAGSFISDQGYAAAMSGQCAWPCGESIFTIYGEGKVYGIDARAKYRHQIGEFGLYGAIGAFGYHSTYNTWLIDPATLGRIKLTNHWTENRVRPSLSIGIEYKTGFIEYTVDRHVGTEFSAFDKAQTLHVGMRF